MYGDGTGALVGKAVKGEKNSSSRFTGITRRRDGKVSSQRRRLEGVKKRCTRKKIEAKKNVNKQKFRKQNKKINFAHVHSTSVRALIGAFMCHIRTTVTLLDSCIWRIRFFIPSFVFLLFLRFFFCFSFLFFTFMSAFHVHPRLYAVATCLGRSTNPGLTLPSQ